MAIAEFGWKEWVTRIDNPECHVFATTDSIQKVLIARLCITCHKTAIKSIIHVRVCLAFHYFHSLFCKHWGNDCMVQVRASWEPPNFLSFQISEVKGVFILEVRSFHGKGDPFEVILLKQVMAAGVEANIGDLAVEISGTIPWISTTRRPEQKEIQLTRKTRQKNEVVEVFAKKHGQLQAEAVVFCVVRADSGCIPSKVTIFFCDIQAIAPGFDALLSDSGKDILLYSKLETLDLRNMHVLCLKCFQFGQFDGEWACMKQWLGCFAGLQGHLQRKGSDRSAFSVPWWCLNDQFWVNKKWECLENAWKRYALFGTLQGRWPAFSDDFRVSDTLFAEARRGVGRGKSSPTPKRWNAFGVHRRRGVVHVIPIWHLSPSKAQDSSTKGVHFMLDEINKPQIRPLWQVLAVFNAPQKASTPTVCDLLLLRWKQLKFRIDLPWFLSCRKVYSWLLPRKKKQICWKAVFRCRWKCTTWPRWMQLSLPLKLRQSWKTSLSAWKPRMTRR